MYDFVGKRQWLFLISAALIIAGVVFLRLGGLKLGIEFQSGASLEIQLPDSVDTSQLEEALSALGYDEAVGHVFREEGLFRITTREISGVEKDALIEDLNVELDLEEGSVSECDFRLVDPEIAGETLRNAAIAVAAAAVVILFYVTFAFRKMPNPFRYGTCAIVALVHDVCITIGIFSILGWAFDWEVNPMFIVAMLAIIGYSVNDTIVVFDRIRENLQKSKYSDLHATVNASLTQSLTRSLNTSITTLLVILALYFFVGADIRNFVVAMLIGVVAGTYSSIFIASQLLVLWEDGGWRQWVPPVPVLRGLRA